MDDVQIVKNMSEAEKYRAFRNFMTFAVSEAINDSFRGRTAIVHKGEKPQQ